MRGKKAYLRRSRGFTLVEIIVVVAIVAIAAALAVPSLVGMQRNMEMARLDAAAKQIYLIGQNRLITMRENGTLSQINAGDELGRINLLDAGGAATYRVAASSEPEAAAALSELLPKEAIDPSLREGYYIVVFQESNRALMREVYYSETAFRLSGDDRTLSRILSEWRGSEEKRRAAGIGFYNGGVVDSGTVASLDTPKLEVVNGERLEIRITLPSSVSDPRDVLVKINVKDMSLPNRTDLSESWTLRCDSSAEGFDSVEGVGSGAVYVKVLDELFVTGKDFMSVCPHITPGANIRVSASLEPREGLTESYFPSASAYYDSNSLFAGLSVETREVNGYTQKYLQFQVSSGRHLQNLDLLVKVDDIKKPRPPIMAAMDEADGGTNDYSIMNYYSVSQTGDIDWSGNYSQSFTPIGTLAATKGDYCWLTFFNGNGYTIKGLTIRGSQADRKAWGLFATLTRAEFNSFMGGGYSGRGEIRSLRLVDPIIEIDGAPDASVGAIAGAAVRMDLIDCHVYVEDTAHTGDYTVSATGGAYLGGLIGSLSESDISFSSVSLPRISGSLLGGAGGLSGRLQGGRIKGCYVNVDELDCVGGETGLFACSAGGVEDSYGLSAWYGGDLVSGGGAVISNSYSVLDYGSAAAPEEIMAGLHGLYGDSLCPLAELNDQLSASSAWKTDGVEGLPYDSSLGGLYPYPSPRLDSATDMKHYGDWPPVPPPPEEEPPPEEVT